MVQLGDEFGPSLVKEDSHVVSGFANRAVVLVENLTVAEHQVHILAKLVPQLVPGQKGEERCKKGQS